MDANTSNLSQALTVGTTHDAALGPVARWAGIDDHHLDPIRVVQTLHDPSLLP